MFNYLGVIRKSTAVNHCVSCYFFDTKTTNLILYKNNRIDFYHLTQEGIQLFEIKDLKKSNQKLTIAEFLSEYIIFMKAFMTDNNKNINNFNLINKFFNSEEQIYITTVLMKEEKEKYLFVSLLGGMFRYYYNQINKEAFNIIENEKFMNYAFDGLIQFYPSLMKMVIDSKEIK